MQYEKNNLLITLALTICSLAAGALAVYAVASHGALAGYCADLLEGGSGPVGFVKGGK